MKFTGWLLAMLWIVGSTTIVALLLGFPLGEIGLGVVSLTPPGVVPVSAGKAPVVKGSFSMGPRQPKFRRSSWRHALISQKACPSR